MLTSFSVKKPYTVAVLVVLIIILGGISLYNMSVDLLPSMDLPFTVVIVPYIGATPEEVESRVTRPVEQAMASISNIRNIRSISMEHMAIVIQEFSENASMDSVIIEMRENLDMISFAMPDNAGSPMIMKLNPDMMPIMVLSAAVEGQSMAESSDFLENTVMPELERIEGIASVTASGLIQEEVHIILDKEKIEETEASFRNMMSSLPLHLFLSEEELAAFEDLQDMDSLFSREVLSGILQGQNLSMPVGYVTEEGMDYMVRLGDRIVDIEDLKNLALFSLPVPFPGLEAVRLQDVASVSISDNSMDTYGKVNQNDAIILMVQKQPDYVTADLARDLRSTMRDLEGAHEGLLLIPLMDQGEYIDYVVQNMGRNIFFGGLLAIFILLLFLRDFTPTLVMAFSIPISLLTALVLMYFSNVTLNMLSMGGLALGVGMLVDNSIVVMENIYRMRNEGMEAKEAAVKGAREVGGAIIASTLTTVSVFLPIVFTSGLTRQLFTDMGLTIAYALLASLVIALSLIPMMSAGLLQRRTSNSHRWLQNVLNVYEKILYVSLRKRALIVVAVLILFVGSTFLAFSKGTELFPAADMDQINVSVTLPAGTPFQEATRTADQFTDLLLSIPDVETVGASIGGDMMGMDMAMGGQSTLSFYVLLKRDRDMTSGAVSSLIREMTEDKDYSVNVMDMGMDLRALTGGDVVVNVKGQDLDTLRFLAQEVAEKVAGVEGTVEVSSGLESTVPEYRLQVNKDKSIGFGLTVGQIMMEVADFLSEPSPATTLRVGRRDYDVRIYSEEARERTLEDIKSLTVQSPLTGEAMAIGSLVDVHEGEGFASIQRENQQRFLSVTADVADGYNIGLVSEEIEKRLVDIEIPDGYSIAMGGEIELITEAFDDLYILLILGIAFIYLIMVAQFQSLLSPFIVMFTIPLAFTGGFLSLIITGNPVSIVAFVGLIILAGVVVNNGIVFIDYINRLRASGMEKNDAIIKAGRDRFRPIIMTALTTVFALSTMAMGVGRGAEMIQPMAITAVGGLIYATFLTLLMIPVLYHALHRK